MQIEIGVDRREVAVRKDIGDPRFSNDDSWFFYRLKKEMQRQGHDCIKKPAWKDGNLVGDGMYYVRARNDAWSIYDHNYALRSCAHEFDTKGVVILSIGGRI